MTISHGGTGCTDKDRDLNSHIDITTEADTRGIDRGPNNDNESTNSSDTMLALEGLEADDCLGDLLASSQANLTMHMGNTQHITMNGSQRNWTT